MAQRQSLAQSDPICSSAGCEKTKLKKAAGYPMDYPVPNFGVDRDILTTHNSLDVAEGIRKRKWNWILKDKKDVVPAPTQYNWAPELDADVISTQKHMGDAEVRLKTKWEFADVQLADNTADAFDESSDESGDDNNVETQQANFHKVEPLWDTKQSLAQSDPISSSVGWPKSKA